MVTEKPGLKVFSFSFVSSIGLAASSSLQKDPNSIPTAFPWLTSAHTYHAKYCCIQQEELFQIWSEDSLSSPPEKDFLNQLIRTSQFPVCYPELRPSAIKLSIGVLLCTHTKTFARLHLDLWQGNFHVSHNLILGHCSKCKVHHPLLSQFINPSSPKVSVMSPLSNHSSHHCPPSVIFSVTLRNLQSGPPTQIVGPVQNVKFPLVHKAEERSFFLSSVVSF